MRDAHLLLMRELATQPGMTFEELQHATGLADAALARFLSALYVVGSITANPRRASDITVRVSQGRDSAIPSAQSAFSLSMQDAPHPPLRRPNNDLTAPLPLLPDMN
jgi:hypothetical protein